jgi:hypothetical protein
MNIGMDKKAIEILKKYDLLAPMNTSFADFSYAKEKGVMFDCIKQSHDDCMEELFEIYNKCSKSHIVNSFLYSFFTGSLNYRAGLSVYAIMQKFPYHYFEGFDENQEFCKHCASTLSENIDLNFFNQCRITVGGTVSLNVYEYAFYLKQANVLNNIYPSKDDFNIFLNILDVINSSNEKDTPNILIKKIRKISGFKSNEEQRKALLETLGYCSILNSHNHKGFLDDYTVLELAPRKTHSSDWNYPIDWWTGKDGLNKDALMFWFADYPELRKFIEQLPSSSYSA